MNSFKSIAAKIWGSNASSSEVISLTAGELYIIRPNNSLKGTRECIFHDALIAIRRSTAEFNYMLVVERVFQEGEEALVNPDEEGEDLDASSERSFLIDEALSFRVGRLDNEATISWRDMDGDPGDRFEFVVESKSVPQAYTSAFVTKLLQCAYERKHARSSDVATEEDLEALLAKPQTKVASGSKIRKKATTTTKSSKPAMPSPRDLPRRASTSTSASETTPEPKEATPEAMDLTVLQSGHGELHLFDAATGVFMLHEKDATAQIVEETPFTYWLVVHGPKQSWVSQLIESRMNATFNTEHKAFIWNYYDDQGRAYSWLLRFPDKESKDIWQEAFGRYMWETLNRASWTKADDTDRAYTRLQYEDVEMTESGEGGLSDEEEGSSAFEDAEEGRTEDEEATDEEDDLAGGMESMGVEDHIPGEPKHHNSQLASGYKNDRSFVVRGSKIGVFKHTADEQLEYSTTINNISDQKGKRFTPKKVMLHQADRSLILQDPNNSNALSRMDLETGKVVDEWKIHDDVPVTSFAPDSKYAQMTDVQTLVGISGNSLFRIDPRLAGNKLVDSQHKQYVSKNKFSAVATTAAGYLVVVSDKGDIRMFDAIGKNAKTVLPPLGDPYLGVDVTADGRYIVATCKTYLLLIDTKIKEGRYEGQLGFVRSFSKDHKPVPRRLKIQPKHVSYMDCDLSFTTAHFNRSIDGSSDPDNETTIVTSTGPYVITWDFKKVKKGNYDAYAIRKYHDDIIADDFKFGADRNIIIALPDDVTMAAKRTLLKPTRQSLLTPTKLLRNRHSTVNSPY